MHSEESAWDNRERDRERNWGERDWNGIAKSKEIKSLRSTLPLHFWLTGWPFPFILRCNSVCDGLVDVFLFHAFDNENNCRDFSSETNCRALLFPYCGRVTLKSGTAQDVVVAFFFVHFHFEVKEWSRSETNDQYRKKTNKNKIIPLHLYACKRKTQSAVAIDFLSLSLSNLHFKWM